MTVTLELTAEEEAKLQAKAARAGVAPAEYLRMLIDTEPSETPSFPDMASYLRDAGVLGAVTGTPRSDGRAWSEIEAACDAD